MAAVVASKVSRARKAKEGKVTPASERKILNQLTRAEIYQQQQKQLQAQEAIDEVQIKKVIRLQPDSEGNFEAGNPSENVILYIGIGMICVGLVITMVGLGDKGFRTLELKLVGPSFVGCGVFFTLLRILLCTMPSSCKSCFRCCSQSEDSENLIKKDKDPHRKRLKSGSSRRMAKDVNVRQVNGDVVNNRKQFAKNQPINDRHANANGHVRRISSHGQPFISDEDLVTVTDLSLNNINLRNTRQSLQRRDPSRQIHYRKSSDSYSTGSSSTVSVNHQGLYRQEDDDPEFLHHGSYHPDIGSYHPDIDYDHPRTRPVHKVAEIPGSTRNIKSSGVILNATELRDGANHIEGSRVNIKSADIFLNASKLQIEI